MKYNQETKLPRPSVHGAGASVPIPQEEAKALFELVRERYSSAAARLADVGVLVSASSGNLEELLRPLNDPALLPEIRRAIEDVIKAQVCDLSVLAECRSLTTDHPLRTAAAA